MSLNAMPPNARDILKEPTESLSKLSVQHDDETQDAVFGAIDAVDKELRELNLAIHDNPELGFEEKKAHANLVAALSKLGFTVTNPSSLPTAFVATYTNGKGGRTFGLNSEYDALPDIGHACGHNLIAVVGVAAAVGIKAALKARNMNGTVKLIGTPAEEGGGGKVTLIEEGVYDDLDACAMAHPEGGVPSPYDGSAYVGGPASLARAGFSAEFHGKEAHAGAAPWLGINALDAAVQGYTAVSMLRQQLEPNTRVHGIIQGSERWAQNIIPAYAKVTYGTRAIDVAKTKELQRKVIDCFENAAKSTGCKCHVQAPKTGVYAELRNNEPMATAYADYMTDVFGQNIERRGMITASTDFGNVTYKCPAIHPGYHIEADGINHTPEFTAGAGSKDSHERSMKVAKGLAMIGAKIIADDKFAAQVKASFDEWKKDVKVE